MKNSQQKEKNCNKNCGGNKSKNCANKNNAKQNENV